MKNSPATPRQRLARLPGLLAVVVFSGGAMALSATAHAVDTTAAEGDTMTFAVKLGAAPNGWAVRYKYRTQDYSAHAGDDYTSTTGTVTFSSGQKERRVYVDTIDDTADEGPEAFKLKLYDQEVNGLYRGVTGWVTPTSGIRSMPSTISLTGQINDNDSATAAARAAAVGNY